MGSLSNVSSWSEASKYISNLLAELPKENTLNDTSEVPNASINGVIEGSNILDFASHVSPLYVDIEPGNTTTVDPSVVTEGKTTSQVSITGNVENKITPEEMLITTTPIVTPNITPAAIPVSQPSTNTTKISTDTSESEQKVENYKGKLSSIRIRFVQMSL